VTSIIDYFFSFASGLDIGLDLLASALSIWPHLTYLVMDGESGELTE